MMLILLAGLGLLGGAFPDQESREVLGLIKELSDPKPETRALAARELGKIGQEAKSAVPALIDALKDESAKVREYAAYALKQMGPAAKPAVPALITLLKDKDTEVRSVAADALGKLKAKEAVAALAEGVKDRESGPHCANALGVMRAEAKEAIPTLTEALKDATVRPYAAQCLGQIGPDALPALKKALEDKDENTLVVSVHSISNRRSDVIFLQATAILLLCLLAPLPEVQVMGVEDVIGCWTYKSHHDSDLITFNRDGTYIRVYVDDGFFGVGTTMITGLWNMDEDGRLGMSWRQTVEVAQFGAIIRRKNTEFAQQPYVTGYRTPTKITSDKRHVIWSQGKNVVMDLRRPD